MQQTTFKATSIAHLGVFIYLVAIGGHQSDAQELRANPLLDLIQKLVDTVVDQLNELVNKVTELISKLKDDLFNAASGAINATKNLIGALVDKTTGIVTGLVNKVGGVINAAIDWIVNLFSIGDLVEPVVNSLTRLSSEYLKLAVPLMDDSELQGKVLGAVDQLLGSVQRFVNILADPLGRLIADKNPGTLRAIQVLSKTVQALQGIVEQILDLLNAPNLTETGRTGLHQLLATVQGTLNDTLNSVNVAVPEATNQTVQVALSGLSEVVQKTIELIPDSL